MKKIFIITIMICSFLTGCKISGQKNVTKKIIKSYDNSKGYKLDGDLEIINNDDVYNYTIISAFDKKRGYYKVLLKNKSNGFEQVILKNSDGVYLITPSMNKSFKFSSDWPYNNSQIYLYDTIIRDIDKDKNRDFEFKDDKYIFNTKVHYSNNSKFVKQKIIYDKNYNLKQIDVYDSENNLCMKLTVNKLSFSSNFNNDYFDMNYDNELDNSEKTMKIDDIIYPLFLPSGTKLVDEKKLDKSEGQRVIMTYDGEKNFLLVEETLDVFNNMTIIPSSGEPFQLIDTIGVINNNSLSWISGNIEYYLVSDVMGKDELVEIAQSIVGLSSIK